MSNFCKNLFLCHIVIVLPFTVSSQVTIGAVSPSEEYMLLQIKENDSTAANSDKGLLMPRVVLSDTARLQIGSSLISDSTEKARHTGLLVYNTTSDTDKGLCPGLYVWTGKKWSAAGHNCLSELITFFCENLQPDTITASVGDSVTVMLSLPYLLEGSKPVTLKLHEVGREDGLTAYLVGGGIFPGMGMLLVAVFGRPVNAGIFSMEIRLGEDICHVTLVISP